MSDPDRAEVTVDTKLSWDEIKRRYPDEWVILVDYTHDDNEDIEAGVIFDHDRKRQDLFDRNERFPSPFAILFTGRRRGKVRVLDEDMEQKG